MPILIDDTHDKAEREGESFAREQAYMTDRLHEPRGEFVPAAIPPEQAELTRAYNLMTRWRDRAERFERDANTCNDRARQHAYQEKHFPAVGTAEIATVEIDLWHKRAADCLARRDECRIKANEANAAYCTLAGIECKPLTWEGPSE